jgi:glycosyltransferase involved in cell wall biosynthesis
MKILIVNISDLKGGASRAAYRLHQALLTEGVDSHMLVAQKQSSDDRVHTLNATKKERGLNLLRPTIDNFAVTRYKNRKEAAFSPAIIGSLGVIDTINAMRADVVHLHWIVGAMIRIEDLVKIEAPIVWSLHDMWAFTGGCHYDDGCGAYEQYCGNCQVLGSSKEHDLSRKIYERKKRVFSQIDNLTIVGLSQWISESAKRSTLLAEKRHINLPNPIDTSFFKPFDREKARELWSLPQDKKLVLFGAMGATSDPRKGFKELSEAIVQLPKDGIELVVLGASKPLDGESFGLQTHYMGTLHDNVSLITLYSAVDVVVIPSLQENLSNVIMESLSCGTPVVGFDIGGNSDMIEHQKIGFLATPFESSSFAKGIEWVLKEENHQFLSLNAREKVKKEFDFQVVAKQYMKLYEEVFDA